MLPMLPFTAGLLAGAAAVGLLRSARARSAMNETGDKLRTVLGDAEEKLRDAAQAGLTALRRMPATVTGTAASETSKATSKAAKPSHRAHAAKAAAKPRARKTVAATTAAKPRKTAKPKTRGEA